MSSAPLASPANQARPPLTLVWLDDVKEAEDGRGARVAASRALAFDVDARLTRPRADVPELRVGELVLSQSYYPRPGVLRFVLARGEEVPSGVSVTLGHVGEGSRRILLEASLEVPR